MNRRQFLKQGLQGSMAAVTCSSLVGTGFAQGAAIPFDIHSLVEAKDSEILRLIQDVFKNCVLGKLRPAEE